MRQIEKVKMGATTMPEQVIKDPYRVKRGDTLSGIGRRCGKTVAELASLNKLTNPNRLDIGQTLYLSRESSYGVSVLFLDALRHPIENLNYKIKFDGQTLAGQTPANGSAPRLTTQDAKSLVEVWIKDLQGQWQKIFQTASGHGHQLITLVSGALVFNGATQEHPRSAPAKPESDAKQKGQSVWPVATGTPTKNNPHVKTARVKGKHGQAIIQVSVDIPQGLTKLFELYKDDPITPQQWDKTAERLECEVEVLRAIAEVETKGAAFWRLNEVDGKQVPSILFERHWFRRLTKGAYNTTHPDISGPAFTSAKGAAVNDRYGSYATSYLRLINAYRLNPEAALSSCSWGKFQIMGGEYHNCGLKSARRVVELMCAGESGQIDLLAMFIQNKANGKLWAAVKAKDWAKIALYYNGDGYKKNAYDTKFKQAYQRLKANAA